MIYNIIIGGYMKRFVLMGVISSIVLASCHGVPYLEEGYGHISFRFAQPLESVMTKADALPDTNAFILLIKSNSGDSLYYGKYCERPKTIEVPSGTYEVSVKSQDFEAPAFETRQYGDNKVIVVSNGENVQISFLCKQLNCGLIITFTDKFKTKFSGGQILLRQTTGELLYAYEETRTAYVKASNADFFFKSADTTQALFSRNFGAGELYSIELDASSSLSHSEFSISIDTTVTRISEKILIGDGFYGEDGSSASKALSVSAAKNKIGETLWVWGYVVGGDMSSSSMSFSGPFAKNTHFAIAFIKDERAKENCFSVGFSKDTIRNVLNLVDNPSNLGKKVFIKGKIDSSYFGVAGIKSISEYQFE